MKDIEIRTALGTRAFWGHVGHAGTAFAPAPGTYAGVDAERLTYTTIADSGRTPAGRRIANLYLLVAAAMYEAAFAVEAGPMSTWSN